MGARVSFPVSKPPISFQKASAYSATGKKVPRSVLDDLEARNEFEFITENCFQDIMQERIKMKIDKAKLKDINVTALAEQFPNLEEGAIQDFKMQFLTLDMNRDGLIDYEEFAVLLDELEDDSNEETRRGNFSDIDIDGSGAIDFEEFLEYIHTIITYSDQTRDKIALLCKQGSEKAKCVRRMSIVTQMENGLF